MNDNLKSRDLWKIVRKTKWQWFLGRVKGQHSLSWWKFKYEVYDHLVHHQLLREMDQMDHVRYVLSVRVRNE